MIRYREGYRYQLAHEHLHPLPDAFKSYAINTRFFGIIDGCLVIRTGYAWDGATWAIDTKTGMRGSLIHDVLCQACRMGFITPNLKEAIDRELQRICIEDGMMKLRAWSWYQATNRLGAFGIDPNNRREIHTAGTSI